MSRDDELVEAMAIAAWGGSADGFARMHDPFRDEWRAKARRALAVVRERGWRPMPLRSPNAKLTDADVAEVRRMLASGMPHRLIAAKTKASRSCVGRIARGETYGRPLPHPPESP